MEPFWKATAVIILSVVLGVAVGKTEKDISVVLSITACCIIMAVVMQYLSEVIAFLWSLTKYVSDQDSILHIMLRISGVALLTELTSLISTDAGNSSLAKAMEILGNAAILFLSLPLFKDFFTIIQEIMGLI